MHRILALSILALTGVVRVAAAQTPPSADTSSSLTCPAEVAANTPFTCEVAFVVGESAPDTYGDIQIRVPSGLLQVRRDVSVEFDRDFRTLRLPLEAVRGTHRFSMTLIADPRTAGQLLELEAFMSAGTRRNGFGLQSAAAVRVPRRMSVDLGYATLPFSSLTEFLLLVAAVVVGLVVSWIRTRRSAAHGAMFWSSVAVFSLAALWIGVPSAVESIRARVSFVPATCTVLDLGIGASTSDGPMGPLAAVEYDFGGRHLISTGLDVRGTGYSGSTLDSALAQFPTEQPAPCWVDPTQPQRVVLRRGPSGGAMMTLLPLVTLVLALRRPVR